MKPSIVLLIAATTELKVIFRHIRESERERAGQ